MEYNIQESMAKRFASSLPWHPSTADFGLSLSYGPSKQRQDMHNTQSGVSNPTHFEDIDVASVVLASFSRPTSAKKGSSAHQARPTLEPRSCSPAPSLNKEEEIHHSREPLNSGSSDNVMQYGIAGSDTGVDQRRGYERQHTRSSSNFSFDSIASDAFEHELRQENLKMEQDLRDARTTIQEQNAEIQTLRTQLAKLQHSQEHEPRNVGHTVSQISKEVPCQTNTKPEMLDLRTRNLELCSLDMDSIQKIIQLREELKCERSRNTQLTNRVQELENLPNTSDQKYSEMIQNIYQKQLEIHKRLEIRQTTVDRVQCPEEEIEKSTRPIGSSLCVLPSIEQPSRSREPVQSEVSLSIPESYLQDTSNLRIGTTGQKKAAMHGVQRRQLVSYESDEEEDDSETSLVDGYNVFGGAASLILGSSGDTSNHAGNGVGQSSQVVDVGEVQERYQSPRNTSPQGTSSIRQRPVFKRSNLDLGSEPDMTFKDSIPPPSKRPRTITTANSSAQREMQSNISPDNRAVAKSSQMTLHRETPTQPVAGKSSLLATVRKKNANSKQTSLAPKMDTPVSLLELDLQNIILGEMPDKMNMDLAAQIKHQVTELWSTRKRMKWWKDIGVGPWCINMKLKKLGTSRANGDDRACQDCEIGRKVCMRMSMKDKLTVLPLGGNSRTGSSSDFTYWVKR
jgi:hypothetical protein